MGEPVLVAEVSDHVMQITLNRPGARNALNTALAEALHDALDTLQSDSHWHVAILTGAGPGFCAGLDVKEFDGPSKSRQHIGRAITAVGQTGKPIIAAVNGAAITGGLEILLQCDFALAGRSASFADTHARLGTFSGTGLASCLSDAIGPKWASQMMLTGAKIDAETALRIGLVNEVVDDQRLLARARELAAHVATLEPAVAATLRRTLRHSRHARLNREISDERDIITAHREHLAG